MSVRMLLTPTRMPSPAPAACAVLAAALGLAVAVAPAAAQVYPRTDQSIAPAYEGWEQNDDGTFNLVFGYMNRNWDQELDVPVGPDNRLDPGAPDRGQPTHFQPRRNRHVFRVRVPADFGDGEVVWTLTSNGQTERAYATLHPDYFLNDIAIMNNNGAGGPAGGAYNIFGNERPVLDVEGDSNLQVRVGEPVVLDRDGQRRRRAEAAGHAPAEMAARPRRRGYAEQRQRSPRRLDRLPRRGPRHVRSPAVRGVGGLP